MLLLLLLPGMAFAQVAVDTTKNSGPVSFPSDPGLAAPQDSLSNLFSEDPLAITSSRDTMVTALPDTTHLPKDMDSVINRDLRVSDIPNMMVDSLHHRIDTTFNGIQPLYLHFHPNPQTALWLSFIFPGIGQIYNRKFWKLPIIYGLGAGAGFAIAYTNSLYKAYLIGYNSFSSDNPDPSLYSKLIPKGYPTSSYSSYLKNQMDNYRRYRDLSIVAAVAVYALTIVDAFVDAQLSDFDISPDLSMRLQPTVERVNQKTSVGVGMKLKF